MKAPELDIEDRSKIWDSMQMLFMDTDPEFEIEYIAAVCAGSKYTSDELEAILFNEVLPACRFNLNMFPAPEWCGFEINWLIERVLKKHRYNRRKPIWFRFYTNQWWKKIKVEIEQLRRYS